MQSHCSFGYVSHMCVSLVSSNLCWLIYRFIRFPSLGFFFSHSHSHGPPFPFLLAREVDIYQFYPPIPHTCAVLWDWSCPQGTVVREKKENKKPSISLYSLDTEFPLPCSFGQRDRLFLGVLSAHFAQQQGNVMSRAVFTLGQRGKKREKIPWMFHHILCFSGTSFPSHVDRKRRIFSLNIFFNLFSLYSSLIWHTFGAKPRVKGGKSNPGNLLMYISSYFNVPYNLSDIICFSKSSKFWIMYSVQRFCL